MSLRDELIEAGETAYLKAHAAGSEQRMDAALDAMLDLLRRESADEDDLYEVVDPMMEAWGVIANARDWLIDDDQARQWVEAAQRWRDTHLADYLAVLRNPGPLEESEQHPDDKGD